MELKIIDGLFSVCRVKALRAEDLEGDFLFIARTDEELSLVCRPERVPGDALAREDGWRALRIQGVLDFSLVGILAPIAELLARAKVGIFAVSTYNTDYILVRQAQLDTAVAALRDGGFTVT